MYAHIFARAMERTPSRLFFFTSVDILHCRIQTTGVQRFDFKFIDEESKRTQHLSMVDIGGQRGERKNWIHAFEGTPCDWVACLGGGQDFF